MRPFEIVGEVHIHIEVGHGLLFTAASIPDPHRVEYVLDADLVDRYPPEVGSALYIFYRIHGRSACLGVLTH
jgi:hypothetical protein